MLYKKTLHRVQFEEVSIDTQMEGNHYTIGENIMGEVVVKGGSMDAQLGYVYIYLKTECAIDPLEPLNRSEVLLDKYVISQPFTLKAHQTVNIPFSFKLPFHTPITYRSVKVFLHTGLDVHAGDDPEDIDYIEVGPSDLQSRILQALRDLQLKEGRTNYIKTDRDEYVQVFHFERPAARQQLSFVFLFCSDSETILSIHSSDGAKQKNKELILSIHANDTEEMIKKKFQYIFQ